MKIFSGDPVSLLAAVLKELLMDFTFSASSLFFFCSKLFLNSNKIIEQLFHLWL